MRIEDQPMAIERQPFKRPDLSGKEAVPSNADNVAIAPLIPGKYRDFHKPGEELTSPRIYNPTLHGQDGVFAVVGQLGDSRESAVLDPLTGDPIIRFSSMDSVLGVEPDGIIVSQGRGAARVTPAGVLEPVEGYYDKNRQVFKPTATRVPLPKESLQEGVTVEVLQQTLTTETTPVPVFMDHLEAIRAARTDQNNTPKTVADITNTREVDNGQGLIHIGKVLGFVAANVAVSPDEASAQADLLATLTDVALREGFPPEKVEWYLKNPPGAHDSSLHFPAEPVSFEYAQLVINGEYTNAVGEAAVNHRKVSAYLSERVTKGEQSRDGVPLQDVTVWHIDDAAERVEESIAKGQLARESSPYAISHADTGTVSPLAIEHAKRRIWEMRGSLELPPTETPKALPAKPRTVQEAWDAKQRIERGETPYGY